MSEHTPIVLDGKGIIPASFWDIDWGDEAQANARLIIAPAPELLEALEMVRDADNDNGRKIPSLARAKIDAAIAKAKGEQ